jgi:hypothetical protein
MRVSIEINIVIFAEKYDFIAFNDKLPYLWTLLFTYAFSEHLNNYIKSNNEADNEIN